MALSLINNLNGSIGGEIIGQGTGAVVAAPSGLRGGLITGGAPTQAQVVQVPTQPKAAHVLSKIEPGLPVVGVKVKPAVVDTGPEFTVPDIAGIAAAGILEADLGVVYDIVDYSATALAYGDVIAVTPDGRTVDLHILTRTKAQDRWIPSFAAGKWQFINVSGGALTGTVIAFWTVDEK